MSEVAGARSFRVSGATYDSFMGRYSNALGPVFADFAGVVAPMTAVDVGCGPGALTSALVDRLGTGSVSACDPSPEFVAACRARLPGVVVAEGRAEEVPFDDDAFDAVLTQLVLHFVTDPDRAAAEMRRVAKSGGVVAACVWDFDAGMEMLRAFWDAVLTIDPAAPDHARDLRFGRAGEIAELLESAGLRDVTEATLSVSSTYRDFDELWDGYMAGVGPAGAYCVSLGREAKDTVRDALFAGLGSPGGSFTLGAVARAARGTAP